MRKIKLFLFSIVWIRKVIFFVRKFFNFPVNWNYEVVYRDIMFIIANTWWKNNINSENIFEDYIKLDVVLRTAIALHYGYKKEFNIVVYKIGVIGYSYEASFYYTALVVATLKNVERQELNYFDGFHEELMDLNYKEHLFPFVPYWRVNKEKEKFYDKKYKLFKEVIIK